MAKLKSFKQVFSELDFTDSDTKLKVIEILDKELDSFTKDKIIYSIRFSEHNDSQLAIEFEDRPGINSTSFNIQLNSNYYSYNTNVT
jgi:hypothetical protein